MRRQEQERTNGCSSSDLTNTQTRRQALCPMVNSVFSRSSAVSLPVIPAQLVEAAGCLVLSLALCALHRSRTSQARPGLVVGAYLAAYGALRFFTETLRADERAHPFGGALTISQCISVAAIATGAALLLLAAARTRGEGKVRPDA